MKKVVLILSFLSMLVYGEGSYSVALSKMGMDYTEYDEQGNFLDSETSNQLLGFELDYRFSLSEKSLIDFKFSGYSGDTEYEGSYLFSGTPLTSTTFNILYDLSVDYIGYKQFSNLTVLYGAGIGYHVWYRELSSTQNELYSWWYITPLVGVKTYLARSLSLGANLKYKYGLNPIMQANFIDEDFILGDANSVEISVPVVYALDKQIDIFAEYVYLKQTIGKSNYISATVDNVYSDTWHEPASTDHQNYIKIGATIKY